MSSIGICGNINVTHSNTYDRNVYLWKHPLYQHLLFSSKDYSICGNLVHNYPPCLYGNPIGTIMSMYIMLI